MFNKYLRKGVGGKLLNFVATQKIEVIKKEKRKRNKYLIS